MGIKSFLVRQAVTFAKPYIKAEMNVDRIAEYGCDGIDWAAGKGLANVSDERLAQVAHGCQLGASVFGNIAAAIDPASDGGKAISVRERVAIKDNLCEAIISIVTQEQLDKLVDDACDRVLKRLGA